MVKGRLQVFDQRGKRIKGIYEDNPIEMRRRKRERRGDRYLALLAIGLLGLFHE
jgi:hypothetical protein